MINKAKFICKILLLNLIFICKANAVSCYITMVKASCWKDYDLYVTVKNSETGDKLGDITVSKGNLWNRKEFICKPGMTLGLEAKYVPEIWKGDKDKVFPSTRFWSLPKETNNTDAIGWNVTVCYPQSFSDVPLPPDATADCTCDMQAIPKFTVNVQ